MSKRLRFSRKRRFTTVMLLALAAMLTFGVVVALADAPDPVDVGNKAVPAIPTASASVKTCAQVGQAGAPTAAQCAATNNNAVTVTIKGGWLWATHGSSCTDDRAGVGYAVSWADAGQPGNPVKNGVPTGNGGSTNVAVGALAANALNPQDNVVHPTHNSWTADDTGVVDPATPTQTTVVAGKTVPAWRGGCGQAPHGSYGPSGTYEPGPLNTHGVGSGVQNGVDQGKLPRGLWGPISHTYAKAADIGTICTITYDVHKGTDPDHNGGVGIPSSTGEVTAGGSSRNSDNGAEKNSGTPLGNACPAIIIPQPSIRVTKQPAQQTVSLGGTARWTITVINNGATDLTNIQISDAQAPASCAGALTSLAPNASTGWDPSTGTLSVGASVSYQCHLDNVMGNFTNVVTACANGNGPPCDSDTTDVTQQGAVGIESMASNQDIVPNDRVSLGIDDPNTTAIDGALSPAGSFSFEFWKGHCGDAGSTMLYSAGPFTGTTNGLQYQAATSNSTKLSDMLSSHSLGPDTSGTYYWKTSYSGDTYSDGNQKNEAFSRCTETLTIAN